MSVLSAYQAILFDLDGVLVHSSGSVQRSWRRWAAEHALPANAVERAAHGRRTVDTIRLLAPGLDAPAEAARLETAQARDTRDVSAGIGAVELLGRLRPGEWGVVTSGTRELATARLRAAGLPAPAVLVAGDDVALGKPAPEGYLRGAEALGRPPSRCAVVEDALPGLRAAQAAGCRTIAVTNGGPIGGLSTADLVVTTLADLRLQRDADGLTLWADRAESPGPAR